MPPRGSFRRSRHRFHAGHGLAPLFLALWLLQPACAAAQDRTETSQNEDQPAETLPPATPQTPAETLSDPQQDPAAWKLAAETLLRAIEDPTVLQTLEAALQPESLPGPREAVLRAIASKPTFSDQLLTSLTSLLNQAPDARPQVLSALGSIRTQASARTLAVYTLPGVDPELQAIAARSLTRLTGLEKSDIDALRWLDWFERHENLSEDQWADLIAQGQALRAERANRRSQRDTRLILSLYTRLIEILPENERPDIIAEMLLAPQPAVRRAGVERAGLQHAIGLPLGEPIEQAIVRLLDADDPLARRDAAELALTIGADATADAVIRAVRIENSPEVAEVMLHTAARWPRPELVEPVLTWLAAGGSTRAAAAEAATALAAGGLLDQRARDWIGELLRRADLRDLQEVEMGLLVSVGTTQDLARVGRILDSPDHPSRLSAANALVLRPEGVNRLLNAAKIDPIFIPLAADAVLTHRPTPEGIEALLALRAKGDPNAIIRRIARSLPLAQLLTLATTPERTPEEQALLLEDVLARDITAETEPIYAEAILILAEAQLKLKDPAGALQSLDSRSAATTSPQNQSDSPDARLARENVIRTRSLIWLNRLQEAAELDAPESVWQQALQDVENEPHKPEIEAYIQRLFSPDEQLDPPTDPKSVTQNEPDTQTDSVQETEPDTESETETEPDPQGDPG